MIGILLFFIPAYRGIRFGATFATILALLSMIPLTFIAVAWIFNPSVVNIGELAGFKHLDGSQLLLRHRAATAGCRSISPMASC